MSKHRIYELAKELNTTSKRLIEKLAEINIEVKNHMSLLTDEELDALFKHIGVIRHNDAKKEETEVKKSPPPAPVQPKAVKQDIKSKPRIIRTREIYIDSDEDSDVITRGWNDSKSSNAGRDSKSNVKNNTKRPGFVHVADANSGLRAGFIRDTRPEFKKNAKKPDQVMTDAGSNAGNKQINREGAVADLNQAADRIVRQEPKVEIQQDIRPEIKAEIKPEEKAEIKAEAKVQANAEAKAETKQVTKQEEKPEATVGTKMNTENTIGTQQNVTAVKVEATKAQPETIENKATLAENLKEAVEKPSAGIRNTGNRTGSAASAFQSADRRPSGDKQGYPNKPAGREQGSFDFRRNDGRRAEEVRTDNRKPEDRRNDDRRASDRPANDNRPAYNNRNQFDRRNTADRPHTGMMDNRPKDRPGDRPGDRQSDRQGVRRSQDNYRPASKPLEIPKLDLSLVQKEEVTSQRSETRREYQNKNLDKEIKREQKKEILKVPPVGGKNKRFKPQTIVLNEKKGVSEILSEDFILDEFYDNDGIKRTRKAPKPKKEATEKYIPPKAVLTSIKIPEEITIKDLSEALKKSSTEVIKKLMAMGMMFTVNQVVDFDTAAIIADEFGVTAEKEVVINEEDILFDDTEEDESLLEPRPPVVVVMGHVDHGKTSLLDAIRKSSVTDTEAGGITQHIGAYMVNINDRKITFLDTPGHEAFTAMRARGAQVTDIAILVVAADDGVMPQTIEAINHAKAANVTIIVAINKIDKPGANPEKVKQELTEYGLVAEEWGGDVICVPVSAKKNENIDQLLEMVLLTADVLELKANPNKQAKGTVIEAKLDKSRGPIATLLVQRGTLNVGDSIVTGTTFGRIRAMVDDKMNNIKSAGPSTPVEILGMPEVPEAGEIFYAVTDEKVARHLAEKRKQKQREEQLKASSRVSLDDLFSQIKEGHVKDLNIIVKADVQGSVEAVRQSLEKLSNDEVKVNIIHGGVGAITESDVTLAQVSNAIIIGFNVRPGVNVAEIAESNSVDIRLYRVIYNAIEDIEAAMKGMLEPTFKEVVQGHAEIRQLYKVSGVGTIGGAYVTDGKILRNSSVRIVRNGIVVHEGTLASLKRFKDDVREVAQGYECGLSFERFNDIKEGDIVEAYTMEEVQK